MKKEYETMIISLLKMRINIETFNHSYKNDNIFQTIQLQNLIKVEEGSYKFVNENKNKRICLLCDLYDT